jgi:hypothetical protein
VHADARPLLNYNILLILFLGSMAMLPVSFAKIAELDLLKMKSFKKSVKSPLKSNHDGIQAFRTITTMLALIQCPTETTKIGRKVISKAKRRELRVLDAISALLVREHENVAVLTKTYDEKLIQVVSVVNLNNSDFAAAHEEPESNPWPIRWLALLNSRRSAPLFPENDEDSMKVVDPDTRVPQTLSDHKNNAQELLNTFILTQWQVPVFDYWIDYLSSKLIFMRIGGLNCSPPMFGC